MKKIIYPSLLSLLFWSCTKQADHNELRQEAIKSQAISPKQTSLEDDEDEEGEGEGETRKYTEYACTVNNKAGTKCDDTKGKCKQKSCEAVSSNAKIGVNLSDVEIAALSYKHAQRLVKEGYIDQKDFELSRNLAKKTLEIYNKK